MLRYCFSACLAVYVRPQKYASYANEICLNAMLWLRNEFRLNSQSVNSALLKAPQQYCVQLNSLYF